MREPDVDGQGTVSCINVDKNGLKDAACGCCRIRAFEELRSWIRHDVTCWLRISQTSRQFSGKSSIGELSKYTLAERRVLDLR